MKGRYANKRKKQKTAEHVALAPVKPKTFCQEHPDNREEDHMEETEHNSRSRLNRFWDGLKKNWRVDLAILVSTLALTAYFQQACIMRKAMRVDQRAWISMPFPNSFPLNGMSIPVITQMINSGKTPAKGLKIDVLASVFNKDDKVAVGDFSVGHPHERLHAPGVVFPRDPVPINISVGDYLPQGGKKATVPDEALRQDIANGKRFILFYGRATYHDVFEVEHFTQFCTGSGPGISSDTLKDCLNYNEIDTNEE
jgi:hypothetical protein